MEATETICCNVFPPAAKAAFWYLEKARPKRGISTWNSSWWFDNIWANSATKRKRDKLPSQKIPFIGAFWAVTMTTLPPQTSASFPCQLLRWCSSASISIRNTHSPPKALGLRKNVFSRSAKEESLFSLAAKDFSSPIQHNHIKLFEY